MSTNVPSSREPIVSAPVRAGSGGMGAGIGRVMPFIYLLLAVVLIGLVLFRAPAAPAGGGGTAGARGSEVQRELVDVGSTSPDFTLADAHGEKATVTLSQLTRKQPVLLIYYLGYSCPRCVANLHMLEEKKAAFDRLGIQIVAVGPNTIAELRDSIGMYEDFPFPMLSDADGKVAAAYNLKFGERLLHGCFLIDKDRQIRFAMASTHPYDNYDELLAVCQSLHEDP